MVHAGIEPVIRGKRRRGVRTSPLEWSLEKKRRKGRFLAGLCRKVACGPEGLVHAIKEF
jgi:hypothetical protein